ncbi:hypothetical protein [Bacillus cereus group sp. BfR-BA-02730]|uniref:hypothetical protein n=1 Tax=Bacillus cereus group sp. BfR-BA-02730 TaxID=3094893 RepID=UPI0029C5E6C8|nr:hypothetical protein [Bacillus cereus group sp. BfR-BA-02730]MDX5808782.1 hypothetical protein [Bacillus cereus group sp. BfR-BA-02730]
MKNKNIAIGVGGLSLGLITLLTNPIQTHAFDGVGGDESFNSTLETVWDGVPEHLKGQIKPPMMRFTEKDGNRKAWYDRNNENILFRTNYNGIVYYSPVPPKQLEYMTTMRSYFYVMENFKDRNIQGGYSERLDLSYPNFKTKSTALNQTSREALGAPHYYNEYNEYRGKSGEWRHLGYTQFGSSVENPYFPPDYFSGETPGSYKWDLFPYNLGSKWLPQGPTVWDVSDNDKYFPKKINAIKKLLEQEPSMRYKNPNPYYWADRLSLTSDPEAEMAVFKGTREGGRKYRTLTVKSDESKNLRITDYTVLDENGNVVGTYTRRDGVDIGSSQSFRKLIKGEKYRIVVRVKNDSQQETTLNPTKLDIGYSLSSTTANKGWNDWQTTLPQEKTLVPGESATFTYDNFVVPLNSKKYIGLTGNVNKDHFFAGDNTNPNDDDANLVLPVEGTGNMNAENITLIDRNGNEVAKPIPGEDYKIKYKFKYQGIDIREAVYRDEGFCEAHNDSGACISWGTREVFDHYYYPDVNIDAYYTINRKLPKGETDAINGHLTKRMQLRNGTTFEFITPEYTTYEVPIIDTSIRMSLENNYDYANIDKDDDTSRKKWHSFYNYKVKNVEVLPKTERPTEAGYQTFAVKFDVVNEVPDEVNDFEKDVQIGVTVNGDKHVFTEHLGIGENKNIVKEVKVWVDPKTTSKVDAQVYVNLDKNAWEEDLSTQADNKGDSATTVRDSGTAGAKIEQPLNPFDKACALGKNTRNTWNQFYELHGWSGQLKRYSANGKSYEFYKYSAGNTQRTNVQQQEEYKINKVLFKSKLTEDLKLGSSKDGWVDLAKGEVGKIKAGYGYELKVDVDYNTNAFETEPQPWVSNGSGQWVRPKHVEPNIPNELYVKTPDGKILSVSGVHGTNKGLDVKRTGDRNKVSMTYSIKPKDTLGIKKTPKIYVDPNTKDGTYKLQVFTPEINGIPTKSKLEGNTLTSVGNMLCDNLTDLKIEIAGSSTDDLKGHIVQ